MPYIYQCNNCAVQVSLDVQSDRLVCAGCGRGMVLVATHSPVFRCSHCGEEVPGTPDSSTSCARCPFCDVGMLVPCAG